MFLFLSNGIQGGKITITQSISQNHAQNFLKDLQTFLKMNEKVMFFFFNVLLQILEVKLQQPKRPLSPINSTEVWNWKAEKEKSEFLYAKLNFRERI